MTCLSDEEIGGLARGGTRSPEQEARFIHVAGCNTCLRRFMAARGVGEKAGVHAPPAGPAERVETDRRPAEDPHSGERFPRIDGYKLIRRIGQGGMGVVYEAIQEQLDRPVALKVLPTVAGSTSHELVGRFKLEAAAAARLHHTNIIPIYDFGQSRDGYYYAMELIRGQPLSRLIRRLAALDVQNAGAAALADIISDVESDSTPTAPPIDQTRTTAAGDEAEIEPRSAAPTSGASSGTKGREYYRLVARWMAEAAEGLHYAHLHRMVHRDIKPGNLMAASDGRLIVVDFGLVKMADDPSVTKAGSLVGTYRYMSPEQVGAARVRVDARTDVYSLGATFYELLTFTPAFDASEMQDLLSAILFKEPTEPRARAASVPPDLQTICLKAMEKAPAARFQSALAMAEELRRYLADQEIHTRPPGLLRRVMRLLRRRRWEAGSAAALLLAAALVSAGAWWYSVQAWEREKVYLFDRALKAWASGLESRNLVELEIAEAAFASILEREPGSYRVLVNLANLLKDCYLIDCNPDTLDRNGEVLDRAVTADPDRPEAWNARGVRHFDLGALEAAESDLRRCLDASTPYWPALVNLAMVHTQRLELQRALDRAQQAVDVIGDPNALERVGASGAGAMAFNVLACIQLHLGLPDARQSLEAAAALVESSPVTLTLSAFDALRHADGDYAAALELATTAARSWEHTRGNAAGSRCMVDLTLARARRAQALAYLRLRNWRPAADAAKAARDAGDDPVWSHLIRTIAIAHLGDLPAAAAELASAQSAWPAWTIASESHAVRDNYIVWLDSRRELEALRDEARGAAAP